MALCCLLFSLMSWAYSYESLKVKDYEEMREIINTYIQKTQSAVSESSEDQKKPEEVIEPEEALAELKEGLRILFMRPDTDGLRGSLLAPLETEINTYKPIIDVLAELVREALPVLKSKKSSVILQANALYIVENAISYSKSVQKPEADVIFSDIKKAKIKLSKKLINHLRLNENRGQTASPSHIAKKILKKRLKKRASEKKRAEKEKQMAEAKKAAQEKAIKEEATKKKTKENSSSK